MLLGGWLDALRKPAAIGNKLNWICDACEGPYTHEQARCVALYWQHVILSLSSELSKR